MKPLLLLVGAILISGSLWAQKIKKDTMSTVTTTGYIDMRETKSGYQINEYFIELSDKEIKKYSGKKVIVTGVLLVIDGINPEATEKTQGSITERYFIREPKIKIIK